MPEKRRCRLSNRNTIDGDWQRSFCARGARKAGTRWNEESSRRRSFASGVPLVSRGSRRAINGGRKVEEKERERGRERGKVVVGQREICDGTPLPSY